jgi:hypothetical protein
VARAVQHRPPTVPKAKAGCLEMRGKPELPPSRTALPLLLRIRVLLYSSNSSIPAQFST